MIFDAHIHKKNKESGGFIIGLEGTPVFDGTLNNKEALEQHSIKDGYISFYYITIEECSNNSLIQWDYLKYHPRRERYSPTEVILSIRKNKPKAVMIDTLNEPYWTPYDYWNIAREFNETVFIFAHSGGYLINDFIKICHFQPNVWIDFALTHTTLGKLGDDRYGLSYVNQAIRYALNSDFKRRVLLSSDFPFFNQEDVFSYYEEYIHLLNDNFEELFNLLSEGDKGYGNKR